MIIAPAPPLALADDRRVRAVDDRRVRAVAWAVLASFLVHAVIVALAAMRPVAPAAPFAEKPITVEILAPDQLEARITPPPPKAEAPSPEPVRPPPPQEPAGGMVRPTAMLSARALSDPRSGRARATLATVDDTEKMIQLCGLEAMEQVAAWRDTLHPDRIVAYASAEVAVRGDRIEAGGAAFRSGRAWYGLRYSCRLAPDHATVVAFAFAVGDPVPPEEWEARNLPSDFDGAPD